jgi:hypothetical protein
VPAGVTVNFGADGYSDAIAAINAALGVNGSAFDTDGTISIQTSTNGGGGYVEILSGTAASILGFNLNTGRRMLSVGGDLPSAPEGRINNPFGTKFPGRGDDFKVGILQRPLAALAANTDVLYSDVSKQNAVLQSLGTLSVVNSGAAAHVWVPSTKIYNGYDSNGNKLSVSSTVLDLSAYFVLLDPTTRRRLPNYVSAVLMGNTDTNAGGTAVNVSDTGKSALGANIIKSSVAITGISEGRVIQATGAGSVAAVGDVVGIASATNTTPWNNNGIRWIVDGVIATDYISVRPASKAELSALGQSSPQGQLQTALNDSATGSFGTMTIYTGPFVSGVSLVISPTLPNATQVEVWAFQPLSTRDSRQTPTVVPGLATPLVFGNQSASASYAHLAARRYSGGDTADLLSLQDQTGAYLLKVTSDGNLTSAGAVSIGTAASTLTLSPTGKLLLDSAGTNWWELDTAGVLRGVNTASKLVKQGGSAFNFGTQDNFALNFLTNNVASISVDTSGNLNALLATNQYIQKSAGGATGILNTGAATSDAVQIQSSNGAVVIDGSLYVVLTTAGHDVLLDTSHAWPVTRGWKVDGATGKLMPLAAGSSIIQGVSGLTLNDGANNILVGDGAGVATLQNTKTGATPVHVIGTVGGANGGYAPGVLVESSGTNAGVQVKTAGSVRWTFDTDGNLTAATTSMVQSLGGLIVKAAPGNSIQLDGGTLLIYTGNSIRWSVDALGSLINNSTGTLQMNSQKITGLGAPSANTTDAATTAYAEAYTNSAVAKAYAWAVSDYGTYLPNPGPGTIGSWTYAAHLAGGTNAPTINGSDFTVNTPGTVPYHIILSGTVTLFVTGSCNYRFTVKVDGVEVGKSDLYTAVTGTISKTVSISVVANVANGKKIEAYGEVVSGTTANPQSSSITLYARAL